MHNYTAKELVKCLDSKEKKCPVPNCGGRLYLEYTHSDKVCFVICSNGHSWEKSKEAISGKVYNWRRKKYFDYKKAGE